MKNRRIGIATKVFLVVVVLIVLSDAVLGVSIYRNMNKEMLGQLKKQATSLAECAAQSVDGEAFEALRTKGAESEEFSKIYNELAVFLEHGGLEYVYSLRLRDDGTPEYVADPDPEDAAAMGEDFDEEPAMREAFEGKTVAGSEITTDKWGSHLTAYSPIYSGSSIVGLVGVDISADQIKEADSYIAKTIFAICGIILFLGVVILLILGKALKNGFARLNDKVVDLTTGNGDLTKDIDIHTGDEMETIAGNVNRLLALMRNIMRSISHNSNELKIASRTVAAHIDEVEVSSTEISNTIEEISESMNNTSKVMNQFNESMSVITDAVDEMVKDIRAGVKISDEIRDSASENGKWAEEKSTEVKERIGTMEEQLAERIERAKAVEQINVLTENILSITSQTNLLSLNASIEAARAGEAGRGFAVVAEEIGKLADDSALAASQIQNISAEVVSSVNALVEEAREMLDFMGDTALSGYDQLRERSNRYAERTTELGTMVQGFSNVGDEIHSNVEYMKQSTEDINRTIEETASNLHNISEKTSCMVTNMHDIELQAQKSSSVSDALYSEVDKFKIE